MGRFSDSLAHRIRSRKVAKDIRHPRGFKGTVMWCSLCRGEVMRLPQRHRVGQADQQAAFDRHLTVCPMKDAPGLEATKREILRGQRRIMRRQWWHRRRWQVLMGLFLLAAAVAVGLLIRRS